MKNIMKRKEQIDLKGYTYLCFLFFLDEFIFLMPQLPLRHYSWLTIIISALIASAILLFYGKWASNHTMPAWWKVLLSIPAFFLALYSLLAFCSFVTECSMPDTPSWILPFLLILIAYFAARKGLITVARIGRTLAVVNIIFLAVAFLFLIPEINLQYVTTILMPIDHSWMLQTIVYTGIFTLKGLILLSIQRPTEKPNGPFTKTICTGTALILSSLVITLVFLLTLLVLGNGLFNVLSYPIYYPLGLTHMGQYFERVEIISLILFMTLEFFKLTIIMSYFKETIMTLVFERNNPQKLS